MNEYAISNIASRLELVDLVVSKRANKNERYVQIKKGSLGAQKRFLLIIHIDKR